MFLSLPNSDRLFEIDDEDYEKIRQYNWRVGYRKGIPITIKCQLKDKSTILLGRLLLGCISDNGLDADHKDRNIFNNKKSNLRWATFSQNNVNREITVRNTSGYKGVSFNRMTKKWHSYIGVNNKRINLGFFPDIKDAAKAYNKAAIKYYGEFAVLNTIQEGVIND